MLSKIRKNMIQLLRKCIECKGERIQHRMFIINTKLKYMLHITLVGSGLFTNPVCVVFFLLVTRGQNTAAKSRDVGQRPSRFLTEDANTLCYLGHFVGEG